VKLIAKDGSPVDTENPSWLDFNQSLSGSKLEVTLLLDVSGIEPYTTYTFEVVTTGDSGNEKGRRVNVGIGSLATSFEFKNVMGQEDTGRTDAAGNRIERGGTARIIATTTMDATVDVEYVGNPSNEDDPTFDKSQKSVSEGRRFHEFFFSVDPSSVYAFRVEAEADFDESVPAIQSEVFYFVTGDQISVRNDKNLFSQVSIAVVGSVTKSVSESVGYPTTSTSVKDTTDGSAAFGPVSPAIVIEGPLDKTLPTKTVSLITSSSVS
jgi:hypothetical protein